MGYIKKSLGLFITATTIYAIQSNAQPDPSLLRLEETVVTAQKRAESLQDVPVSVVAVGGEKLEDTAIATIEDLTVYLPNIHFTETGFSTQVRIRGIGSDNSQGFEQSVGTYIDGIYYGRGQLFRTPFMDMERAEILRGPQSILFGKNSIAGALNLTSAKPTSEFEGKISAAYEPEYNEQEYNGVISGPITDNFRARLAARYLEEDGYMENSFQDRDEGAREETAVRLTLDWDPISSLSLTLKAEHDSFDVVGRTIENTRDDAATGPTALGDFTGLNYSQVLGSTLSQPGFDSNLDFNRDVDADEFSDNEIENYTFTLDYEFADHTLTVVTGWLAFDYTENCDCEYTAANIFDLDLFEDYEQFSQEIRLVSPIGGTFEWIVGAFYQDYDQVFKDELHVQSTSALQALLGIGNTQVRRDFEQSSETWALFSQATWNISDAWHLTLGARYTEEDKEGSRKLDLLTLDTGVPVTDATVIGAYEGALLGVIVEQGSGHNLKDSLSESAFTPLINVQFDLNDNLMFYTSYTIGFKAGGFDPRSNKATSFGFKEEKAKAFEAGLKSRIADRAEINANLFHTIYEDLQFSQFDGTVGFNVGNIEETRIQGLEVDGRLLISETLSASYGISLLDFEYTKFENGNCHFGQVPDGSEAGTCDYTDKRGVYTPKYTLNFTLDYNKPINGNLLFISALDVQWVDGHQVHVNLDPKGKIDDYTMVGLRLGIETETWSVALLGKNLLDEEVITYSANVPLSERSFGTNSYYSFVRRPRTVALVGNLKF